MGEQREARREVAIEMARLWKEEPEQWLIRSKLVWAHRHEAGLGKYCLAGTRTKAGCLIMHA